jgi:hypothetical protein
LLLRPLLRFFFICASIGLASAVLWEISLIYYFSNVDVLMIFRTFIVPVQIDASPFPDQIEEDLLHPNAATEASHHKLKRLVQSPNSFFMDVKCPGCFQMYAFLFILLHDVFRFPLFFQHHRVFPRSVCCALHQLPQGICRLLRFEFSRIA